MVVPEPDEALFDEPRARLHLLEPERDRLLQGPNRLRGVVIGRRCDRGWRRGRRAQVKRSTDRGVRVLERRSEIGLRAHGQTPQDMSNNRSLPQARIPTHPVQPIVAVTAPIQRPAQSPRRRASPATFNVGQEVARHPRASSAFAGPVVQPNSATGCAACWPGRERCARRRRPGRLSCSRHAPRHRPPGPKKHPRRRRARRSSGHRQPAPQCVGCNAERGRGDVEFHPRGRCNI